MLGRTSWISTRAGLDLGGGVMRLAPNSLGVHPQVNLGRSSGILLHLTSLPGGKLGRAGYEFVDWLVSAGQSWWQILPVGPPDRHGSPYTPDSVFAASPAFLAEPDAPVSAAELDSFRARERFWIE